MGAAFTPSGLVAAAGEWPRRGSDHDKGLDARTTLLESQSSRSPNANICICSMLEASWVPADSPSPERIRRPASRRSRRRETFQFERHGFKMHACGRAGPRNSQVLRAFPWRLECISCSETFRANERSARSDSILGRQIDGPGSACVKTPCMSVSKTWRVFTQRGRRIPARKGLVWWVSDGLEITPGTLRLH